MATYDELMRQIGVGGPSGGTGNRPGWTGVTNGYGVENPANWSANTQFNQGIGADWFNEMDKWKSVKDGTMGYDPKAGDVPMLLNGDGQTYNPDWVAAQGRASDGFMYVGDDGKRYIIHNQPASLGGAIEPEGSGAKLPFDLPDPRYTVTALHQNNERIGYNGIPHDMFDMQGNYTGTQVPQNIGHDKFWRDAAIMAGMVATAGLGGVYMAPALGSGTAAAGATLGEGALAASGGYGVAAGTAGAAATNAAAAGVGSAAASGGSGAFLGEGVESGVAAWDGAAGGAAGGYGTVPLAGVGAPTAPGLGATGTAGATGASGGINGMLGQSAFSLPGIGSVSYTDLLKYGLTAAGALGGSQGQEAETTSTKEIPEWLREPVYGQGGLIPQSQWLLQQQMGNPGGLLSVPKSSKKSKTKKRGLL